MTTYWPGISSGSGADIFLVDKHIGGFDGELAAVRHRVARVDGQIDERRFEVIGVDLDPPEAGSPDSLDVDRLAERPLQEFDRRR